MSKGLFVSLEGGEGSGKTTVMNEIISKLDEVNVEYVLTREPGGCEIAEEIRNIILDPKNTAMHKRAEALLYAASRAQHVEEVIRPALNDNKVVICDRFVDSSIVYQGYARENSIERIWDINNFALEDVYPDLTIFFDIKPSEAFKRLKNREMDRLDLEDQDFHEKVYDAFKDIVKTNKRIVTIDATKSIEEVVNEVFDLILCEMAKKEE